MTIEVMTKCAKCDGTGQVADTDDQEPWTTFDVHSPVGLGIITGLIQPIPCPECNGEGSMISKREDR